METTDINKLQNRSSKSIRVLAFFKAKLGKGKELEKVLLDLVPLTRNEQGNIAYVLHRSTNDPDELLFDEIFDSYDAFEQHSSKPYIRSLESKVEQLLDAPIKIKTYSEVQI